MGFWKLVCRTLWVWYENQQQAKSLFVVLCNQLLDFFLFTVSAYGSRKMVVRGHCCIPRKSWSSWSDAIIQKTGNFLVLYRCLILLIIWNSLLKLKLFRYLSIFWALLPITIIISFFQVSSFKEDSHEKKAYICCYYCPGSFHLSHPNNVSMDRPRGLNKAWFGRGDWTG